MFGTMGNSFKLLAISWRVLKSDRDLALFPLMSGAVLYLIFAYTAAAFWAGGTFDRIGTGYSFYLADLIFLVLAYLLGSFVIIFFNAALVAAAYQHLEGFDADVRTGLMAAGDRVGAIFGWSMFAATVGVVLDELSDPRSIFGKLVGFALRVLWGYATFFVVPVVIIESASPLEALPRSTELFRQQWSRAAVANFGFGIAYFVVAALALLPAAALYFGLGSVLPAVVVGALLLILGAAVVNTLETIFTVALYDFASTGRTSGGYSRTMLEDAFVDKTARGRFRPAYAEYASRPRGRRSTT